MNTDLVTIAQFDDPTTANLSLGRLKSSGIDAVLTDENTVGIAWHLSTALGGIRLKVRAEDEEQARLLLNSHDEPDFYSESQEGYFTEEDDDNTQDEPNPREKLVRRAFLAGVIGLVLSPLMVYSLVLAVRAMITGGELSGGNKFKLGFTIIMDTLVLAAWILFYMSLG